MAESELARALDRTVTDLVGLGLAVKQVQWNTVGPGVRSLGLLLDEIVDLARVASDRVAERSLALGRHPDGRAVTVVRHDPLPPFAAAPLLDTDATSALAEILDIITIRLFGRFSATDGDLVTQGLLVDIAADLEGLAWKVRAHRTL